jgi:hypothetical protein
MFNKEREREREREREEREEREKRKRKREERRVCTSSSGVVKNAGEKAPIGTNASNTRTAAILISMSFSLIHLSVI